MNLHFVYHCLLAKEKVKKIFLAFCEISEISPYIVIRLRWQKQSCRSVNSKKVFLKNFAKFTEKQQFLVKKETLAQSFSCELCEIFRNTYFYRIPLEATSKIGKFTNNDLWLQTKIKHQWLIYLDHKNIASVLLISMQYSNRAL